MEEDFSDWGLFKPKVSESLAIQLVKEIYGLEVVSIKKLASFCDQNFLIKVSEKHENQLIQEICQDGYTFKVINTKKSIMKGHFDSLPKVLRKLSRNGLKVPLPVDNIYGTTWTFKDVPLLDDESEHSESDTFGRCGIYMLTYVPGTTLADVDWTEQMLFDSGKLLAQLHTALQDHVCPHLKSKVILSSLEAMPFLEKIIGLMNDDIKKLSLQTLEEFDKKIKPHLDNMSKGFVHGDYNDFNILVTDHDGTMVADGIIDFEDVHYGHYVWDICLFLGHVLIDSKSQDPMEDVGIALAGYLSLRGLSEIEMSIVKACIQCRLCQTLDICAWSQQTNPSNEYIAGFSVETRQKFLEQVLSTSEDDFMAKLNSVLQKCKDKSKLTLK